MVFYNNTHGQFDPLQTVKQFKSVILDNFTIKKITAVIITLLLILFAYPAFAVENAVKQEPNLLASCNKIMFGILFFDVAFGNIKIKQVDNKSNPVVDKEGLQKETTVKIPFLVVVLFTGAVFFTFWYRWINLRLFKHSIDVIRGKFDNINDKGEISHFRALTSALSATVGLGNIAGVAIAIQTGGPGAVFWMLIAAVFGMSSKFSSCTLSQLYRKVNIDGSISGGPMYYLDLGLKQKGHNWALLGKILAVLFAVMVMGGAIGGGCMFQANQTAEAFVSNFNLSDDANLFIGITLAILVGLVILGGIKRIGLATSRIVPVMCGIYIIASLFVILTNISKIPETISIILTMAFTQNAFFGGMAGVIVKGITRASFSNEAGLGSAAIAHAAAKTDEPVREGIVAMIGPFIDTIVICLMTAMVVIITGAWNDPVIAAKGGNLGVTLTTEAFGSVIPWFPSVLTICIGLFAYSTMISWCYYGERGWIYLMDHFSESGLKTVVIFRIIFVISIIIGAVNQLQDVLDFADVMILSMAFPNITGSIILAPKVFEKAKDYCTRYKSGQMAPAQ